MPTWQQLNPYGQDPARTLQELQHEAVGLGLSPNGGINQLRARITNHITSQANQQAQAPWAPPNWQQPPAQPAAAAVVTPQPTAQPTAAAVTTAAAPAPAQPAQPAATRSGMHPLLAALFGLTAIAAVALLVAVIILATRDDNGSNTPASGGQTTQAATPTTATSSTAVPSTTPSGQAPNQGATGNGCTNSPNIPCVVAQGQKNGFEPFKVDDQVVGGPADQWWQLQRADGTMVPNSFKMVGMRQSDRSLPGYEMHVPAGMIMNIWLDNGGLTNRKTAARVYGPADIKAEWKVAEATLYSRPVDFVDGLKGKWARLSDTYQCGDFVTVGTLPPVISTPHDCYQPGSGSNSSPTTSAASLTSMFTVSGVPADRFSVIEDGKAIKLAAGECLKMSLPAGLKADIWDGSNTTHPVGPVDVPKACEGTIRVAG